MKKVKIKSIPSLQKGGDISDEYKIWFKYNTREGRNNISYDDPHLDYDYNSYYNDMIKGKTPYVDPDTDEHYPDTYKLPNHPTFSVESMYYTNPKEQPNVISWNGVFQKGGKVNNTGYTKGTSTESNPYNIIPSNQITMENVDYPVLGIPNNDNPKLMLPDNNYFFPNSNYVTEIPMGQKGGEIINKKVKIKSIPLAQNGRRVQNPIDLNLNPEDLLSQNRVWNQPNYNTQTVADNANVQTFQNEGSGLSNLESLYTGASTAGMVGNEEEGRGERIGGMIKNIMPKISLNTSSTISAASGMVNYMDSINTRKREQERLAKQMRPVLGALPINQGLDMPMYAQNGMEIKESSTTLNPQNGSQGYQDDDFEVPLENANVVVEAGETVVHNDGGQTHITGDKHSDYSGGEYRDYPEGSRVFSKKLKASKELIKEVSKRPGIKARLSYADLVKQFNADKENEILNNPNLDSIAQRTAEINKQAKLAKVDEIFDEQETVNGNKEKELLAQQQAMLQQQMMSEQMMANGEGEDIVPPVMAKGGRVRIKSIPMAEEGIELRGGYRGQGNILGYSEEQVADYLTKLTNLATQYGYDGDMSNIQEMQKFYIDQMPDEVVEDYLINQVPPSNKLRRDFNLKGNEGEAAEQLRELYSSGKVNINQLRSGFADNIAGVRIPEYRVSNFDDDNQYMDFRTKNPELNENILFDEKFDKDSNPLYHNPSYNPNPLPLPIRKPQNITFDNHKPYIPPQPLAPLSDATTPKGKDLDREKKRKGVGNKVLNKIQNTGKNAFHAMNDYLPEMIAAGLAVNDFPIFASRMQPKYMQNEVMNVQPALNRNFSQAQPLVEGVTGNASIDNARANQVLANVYSADNEMMGQKFNFDTQNRQQVSNMNVQTENQANQFNTQIANQMADKMAMREHNKNIELNRITNSAYAKSKQIQAEKRGMNAINNLYLNRLKVDADGNANYLTPTDMYDAALLTGQDPMGLITRGIMMNEEQRKALMGQAAKKTAKEAKKNDGTVTGGTPPYKTGGKVKTKYKINK